MRGELVTEGHRGAPQRGQGAWAARGPQGWSARGCARAGPPRTWSYFQVQGTSRRVSEVEDPTWRCSHTHARPQASLALCSESPARVPPQPVLPGEWAVQATAPPMGWNVLRLGSHMPSASRERKPLGRPILDTPAMVSAGRRPGTAGPGRDAAASAGEAAGIRLGSRPDRLGRFGRTLQSLCPAERARPVQEGRVAVVKKRGCLPRTGPREPDGADRSPDAKASLT